MRPTESEGRGASAHPVVSCLSLTVTYINRIKDLQSQIVKVLTSGEERPAQARHVGPPRARASASVRPAVNSNPQRSAQMEDVAPWRTSSPTQGEARRSTKRGQLMLTHQGSSKRPSQARHVGPPGEDPSSAQARSAHADTPGQFKETFAGEARRPTRRGPQFDPSEVSSC